MSYGNSDGSDGSSNGGYGGDSSSSSSGGGYGGDSSSSSSAGGYGGDSSSSSSAGGYGGDGSSNSSSGSCGDDGSSSSSSGNFGSDSSSSGSNDDSNSSSSSSADSTSDSSNENSDSGSSGDNSNLNSNSSVATENASGIDSSSLTGAQLDGSAGNSLNPSGGIVGGTPCSDDIGSNYNSSTYSGISLDGTAGATLDSSETATAYSFSGYISDNYDSTVASSYQSTMDMSGFQNTEVTEPSLLGSAWNSVAQWADQNVVQPIQEALSTPIQVPESTSVANLLADNVPGMTKDEVENGLSNMGLTAKDVNSTTNMIGDEPDAISNWAASNGINPATITVLDVDNALLNNSVENLRNAGDVIVQGVDSSTMGNMLDLSPKARAEFDIVGNSVSNIVAPVGLALTAAISPEAVPYVGAGIVLFSQACSDLSATSRVTASYLVGTVGNILSLVPGMKIAQGWTDEVKLGANVISKQIGLGNGLYGTVDDLQTLNKESKVQNK